MKIPGERRFKLADVFQQMTGSFLLAAPFVVEGGTWELAATMELFQSAIVLMISVGIGYSTLYKADKTRQISKERRILFVPLRLVSLVFFSLISVVILTFLLSAPQAYEASDITVLKAIVMTLLPSVVGAATADSIF